MGSAAAALAALAADVEARIAAFDVEIAQLRADRGAESADDEHDPEGVTLSGEWSRIAGLRDDALRERAEVEQASARVEEGTYGVCVDCGRRIPAARLAARPTAVRCIDCAARAGL
ncbi:TraR/DksA family transcriptional regulator [Microbacterium fluvii]|uniref:TraR/DksA family transcriptional regulator n=1 Tax=Microbacterium fluvii TaxID=415215 RepID=A0ABW2HD26_9MICO|nr:TraR/DksA family transcriptional regulator [Microbacterium fluvii]MCU4672651.1 TraR/DksA family transcriptional regulator [Microbacterium fluvii]